MEILKTVLDPLRKIAKEGPLGILALIVVVAGQLIFKVVVTGGTGLLEAHVIFLLAAIVMLTIVFLITLLLIMRCDRRRR